MLKVRRREFITLLGGATAWPVATRAQQPKVPQIGVLVLTNADAQLLTRELRLGLRDFSYSEGRNFVFQIRSESSRTARSSATSFKVVALRSAGAPVGMVDQLDRAGIASELKFGA
jgi:putative ABC transport system substrate-binding protein